MLTVENRSLEDCAYALRDALIGYHATKNDQYKRVLEDITNDIWRYQKEQTKVLTRLCRPWRDDKSKAVKQHLLNRLKEVAETQEELSNILSFGDETIDVYRVEDALGYFWKNIQDEHNGWCDCVNRLVEHTIVMSVNQPVK